MTLFLDVVILTIILQHYMTYICVMLFIFEGSLIYVNLLCEIREM